MRTGIQNTSASFAPQQDFPWYWSGDEFTGDRRNDIHLSIADKSAHRLAAERTRR